MERGGNRARGCPLGTVVTPFGTTTDNREVAAFTLSGHGLTATILNYGAILQDVRLDDVDHSLTVGSDTFADYEDVMTFHGVIVGPVANRLSGAQATINGVTHHFDANLLGKHTLHSGAAGTHARIWNGVQHSPDTLDLTLDLADGEGGFPAHRHVTATFEILAGPTLRLTITTTADAPSIANLTNHSYWNLDGTDHMNGHALQIDAVSYLPTDDEFVVTGESVSTKNTAFDFSRLRNLTFGSPALDNTFCVAQNRRDLTPVLHLRGASGVSMRVATTEAGLHVYDNRPDHAAIAIEAQGWPDAPNKDGFPSIAVAPDAPAVQITQWQFATT